MLVSFPGTKSSKNWIWIWWWAIICPDSSIREIQISTDLAGPAETNSRADHPIDAYIQDNRISTSPSQLALQLDSSLTSFRLTPRRKYKQFWINKTKIRVIKSTENRKGYQKKKVGLSQIEVWISLTTPQPEAPRLDIGGCSGASISMCNSWLKNARQLVRFELRLHELLNFRFHFLHLFVTMNFSV